MEIKKIAHNTVLLSIPKIVKFVIGVFRTKLIAVFLGAVGAGVISQLSNFLQKASLLSKGGLGDGLVKQIAKINSENNSPKEIACLIKTYSILVTILAVIILFLGLFFAEEVTLYVFGDKEYLTYYLIGFSALPILILSSTFYALLKGYKLIKQIMYSEIIIIITNFILFIPLIYFYKMTGAVVFTSVSFSVSLIIYYFFLKKNVFKKNALTFKVLLYSPFSKKDARVLLSFVGATFTAGIFTIFVELSNRAIIVNKLGIATLGSYSPIISWSSLFLGFILPSMFTYLFPRLSETKTPKEVVNIINDVFRFMTFVLIPFIFFAITFREYLIPLFYSKEFLIAAVFLPFHFVGIFFDVWNRSFRQIFAPTGRLKHLIIISIFVDSLSLLLVYTYVPVIGLWAWTIKFTLVPLISLIITYIYWVKTINFGFKKENIYLILLIILSSSYMIIFRDDIFLLIIGLISILFTSWYIMKKQEREFIKTKTKNLLNKISK